MEPTQASHARPIWLAAAAGFVVAAGLAAIAIVDLRRAPVVPANAEDRSTRPVGSAPTPSKAQDEDPRWLERARRKEVRVPGLGDPNAGAPQQTPLTQAWSDALGKRGGTAPPAQLGASVTVASPADANSADGAAVGPRPPTRARAQIHTLRNQTNMQVDRVRDAKQKPAFGKTRDHGSDTQATQPH